MKALVLFMILHSTNLGYSEAYIATTRQVAPENRQSFITALNKFIDSSRSAPGVLEAYILSEGDCGNEVGILRSFASAEAKNAFYASDTFQTLTLEPFN